MVCNIINLNMDKKRRNKISFVTTLFGLIANALLCAGKFAVGLLCGNIAVTADAVNNLSDAGNNVVTLIAIKVAGKPADKEHPFGHERVEYVSALVVAFIILFLGVELAVSSVEKIILNFKEPYLPEFDAWLVYVLSFSVVVKVVMFFVYRTNGKKSAVSRAGSNGVGQHYGRCRHRRRACGDSYRQIGERQS